MPGAPPRADTAMPESSESAGRPDASAASRAFSSAFSVKVFPVSSGSIRPSSSAPTTSIRSGSSKVRISDTLPGLWLAITSFSERLNMRVIVYPTLYYVVRGT